MTTSSDIDKKIDGFMSRMRRWRRVAIGLFALAIGIWMAYSNTHLAEQAAVAFFDLQKAVASGIPVLSADQVTGKYDGQYVLLQGPLKASTVTDPLTGVTLQAASLHRTVELQQWLETGAAGKTGYHYTKVWRESLIDSDAFHSPLFGNQPSHENPKSLPYKTNIWFPPEDMKLGAWRVPVYYYAQWIGTEVPLPEQQLAESTDPQAWYTSDGYLQNRASDWADVRFHYDYTPIAAGTYSLIGIPEKGVIDLPERLGRFALIEPGKVDAKTLVADASKTEVPSSWAWMVWVFAGVVLALRPMAMPFTALKGFTEAHLIRRCSITVAVALLVTALVGWAF